MPKIHNVNNLPDEYVEDPLFESGLKSKHLGAAAGSEQIYINIDYVKPGAKSARYHSHSAQEEFFLVLSGSGTLRFNGKTMPVKQGDFISKPAGKGLTHQFINDGKDILEILDCGTREENDIITYPDENMVLDKKTDTVFSIGNKKAEDFSSDPNSQGTSNS